MKTSEICQMEINQLHHESLMYATYVEYPQNELSIARMPLRELIDFVTVANGYTPEMVDGSWARANAKAIAEQTARDIKSEAIRRLRAVLDHAEIEMGWPASE